MQYSSAIKKGNTVICANVNIPWGYYAKWISQTEKTDTVWYHLYVELKKSIETEQIDGYQELLWKK